MKNRTIFNGLAIFLFLGLFQVSHAQLLETGVGTYGTWPSNGQYAVFGHKDKVNVGSSYALLQRFEGSTFLNSAAGKHLRFRIGNVDAMIIRSNRRVGIGTVNPGDKLDVSDATHPAIRLSGGGNTAQLSLATANGFYSPMSTPGDVILRSLSQDVILYSPNGDIRLGTEASNGNNEKMTIKANGKVGIGKTNPFYDLDVDGEVRSRGLRFDGLTRPYLQETNQGINFRGNTLFIGQISMVNFNFLNNQVNIGADQTFRPGYQLTVDGKVLVEELTVQNSTNWPDYVFEKDYDLKKLEDVEAFIKQHKHLPEVPAAAELTEGVAVGEMQKTLLKKVEELTLYVIEQNKQLESMQQANQELQARLNKLEQH